MQNKGGIVNIEKRDDRIAFAVLSVVLVLTAKRIFTGFNDVDEADITFDIFKLLRNLATERDFQKLIWVDAGSNGALYGYLYSIFTVPLSYILRIPMDMAMRLTAVVTIPFSGYFIYRSAENIGGRRAALIALVFLAALPPFIVVNSTAIGEPWYTLFYALSFFFISRANNRGAVYISFILFALGLLCKYTFAPLIFIHFAVVTPRWKTIRPRALDLVFGALILLAGFLPLGLLLLISGPEFLDRFLYLEFGKLTYLQRLAQTLRFITSSMKLPHLLLLITGVAGVLLFRSKSSKRLKDSISLTLTVGILISFLVYTIIGTRSNRYVYPLFLPLSIIAGIGIDRVLGLVPMTLSVKNRRLVHAAVLSGAAALILWGYGTSIWSGGFQESDDRRTARYVIDNSNESDGVLAVNSVSFYIFGIRPMAINPIFDTITAEPEGIEIDYRMHGIRRLNLDKDIEFIVIRQSTQSHPSFPLIESAYSKEEQFGDFIIYRRIKLDSPKENPMPRFQLADYNLNAIVKRVRQFGTQQPGELIKTGW